MGLMSFTSFPGPVRDWSQHRAGHPVETFLHSAFPREEPLLRIRRLIGCRNRGFSQGLRVEAMSQLREADAHRLGDTGVNRDGRSNASMRAWASIADVDAMAQCPIGSEAGREAKRDGTWSGNRGQSSPSERPATVPVSAFTR